MIGFREKPQNFLEDNWKQIVSIWKNWIVTIYLILSWHVENFIWLLGIMINIKKQTI